MKFSENWLRELVHISVGRDELSQRLTMSGLEVEELTELGIGLDGVLVGEIVAAERHPDADKLQVCRVDVGQSEPLQIVCGAPNARVGLKAPLAMVGAQIGAITIKAAKLRGVDSFGMLCSAKELGLDADASGLMELASDAPVGSGLAEYLGLPDSAIELGLTPNRSDCLGMHGLAREVAAELATTTSIGDIPEVAPSHDKTISLRVDAAADCPRYCGRLIQGLRADAVSPLWMKERLRRSGVRPISALVDVTNYVMLELGQPLHAFDAAAVQSGIVVRRAQAGEKIKLLDEREVSLDEGFLVIADATKPVALAGIMGGFDSRVTDGTNEIFLESAYFSPSVISGRARKLGLHTDASHRFERGVDPNLPRRAIERATALLLEIAGGSAGPVVEASANVHLPKRLEIPLRRSRLKRVLGVSIADADVTRILNALGMQVSVTDEGWTATPPSSRFDIAIEEDLIEEVARIHGYSNIPAQAPRGEITPATRHEDRVPVAQVRALLTARGYSEAITYAFIGEDVLQRWGLAADSIALANPLSAELAVMRTSLLPGLVAALESNQKRQQSRVRLFEIGRSYIQGESAPIETDRVAAVVSGQVVSEQWGSAKRDVDFFDVKGDVESLFALTGLSASDFSIRAGGPAWLHPGRAATIVRDGVDVGFVGALDPRLQKALDLDEDVYVFDVELDALTRRKVPQAKSLSRFPSLRRDIAVVLAESVAYAEVEAAIRAAVGEVLVDVFLFDRYSGAALGEGMKSLAIGLILQDRSRTLTDQDADQCVSLAVSALATGFDAKLRG
jgi:phenylalanyl-tRNA synthetase beta chain